MLGMMSPQLASNSLSRLRKIVFTIDRSARRVSSEVLNLKLEPLLIADFKDDMLNPNAAHTDTYPWILMIFNRNPPAYTTMIIAHKFLSDMQK